MEHLSVTELAKALGVSRQSIYRAERAGKIKREPGGSFDLTKVRKAWLETSELKFGSIHSRITRELEGENPQCHSGLDLLQAVWSVTLRASAMALRDLGGLSPKVAIKCLGVLFLLQWHVLGESLRIPENQELEFSGDLAKLLNARDQKSLEAWLNQEPSIDWTGEKKGLKNEK
ncbi:MAG: hypothetical protein KC643_29505 [Nitrospira sp.]|nr:hypothetical protein [Nitrospira sp.]